MVHTWDAITMHLTSSSASALAAAIIAAASVLIFSQLPDLLVWAAFIGWASYDHSGGTPQAAVRSSAALVFGVVMACIVATIGTTNALALSPPMTTAISAGVSSFVIVMASRVSYLAIVPATFYGFASTFAYLSLAPGESEFSAMTTLNWRNALITVPTSLLIGTGLGIIHGWLAKVLATPRPKAAPRLPVKLGGKS
jgi:Protein of unknown function (DUF1097)